MFTGLVPWHYLLQAVCPLISGFWHFLPEKGSSMDILPFLCGEIPSKSSVYEIDQPIWHWQPCYIQSLLNHVSSLFWCSLNFSESSWSCLCPWSMHWVHDWIFSLIPFELGVPNVVYTCINRIRASVSVLLPFNLQTKPHYPSSYLVLGENINSEIRYQPQLLFRWVEEHWNEMREWKHYS